MKKNTIIFLLLLSLTVMSFQKHKKTRVVFFGDSITLAGGQPGGYILKMDSMLQQQGIHNYELMAAGVGWDKIYDLYLRMEEDVISKKPDIVVIFEGVNDVGHKASMHTGTDSVKYERFYRAIIKRLQAKKIRPVLCTMAVIGEKKNNANADDKELDEYASIIKRMAADLNLPLVDIRSGFKQYYTSNNPDDKDTGILTRDRIHLNEKGNQMVMQLMWEVLKNIK